ncbi:MAG: hypothetical protein ACK2UK_18105 [Candidatus Promineifilaceae bacterium]
MSRFVSLFLSLIILVCAAALVAAFQGDGLVPVTTVLYDGSLGTTPDEQGFSFLAFGISADQQFADGVTILDSTGEMSDQAGYFNEQSPVLDRSLGYRILFELQIEAEEHANGHRAGFSLLVLSDDRLGLEIGFWEDAIWVQEGGPGDKLFTRAETINFDTGARTLYELAVEENTYQLSAGGQELMSGPLRDYSSFEGFPDPYESPNLIFLGDDTSRAASRTAVAFVAVETFVAATATPAPSPTNTATPTATGTTTPTVTAPAPAPTSTPRATPAATPKPSQRLYVWLPCLKGVDPDVQK